MWDSAKKPIKIRSVLQSNGMRHYIVNEESEQVFSNSFLQPPIQQKHNKKRKNNKSSVNATAISDNNSDINNVNNQRQENCNENSCKEANEDSLPSSGMTKAEKLNPSFSINKKRFPLIRANSQIIGEYDGGKISPLFHDSCDDFFGVAGSRIYNSRKHKSQYNRYFPHYIKDATLAQLQKDSSILSKCPHMKEEEALDFIPVKSPVIKKLINGSPNSHTHSGKMDGHHQKNPSSNNHEGSSSATSTTLCSRIMTWIDLEVKRNAVKGNKPSSSLSFSSADLNIVNEVNDFEGNSTSSLSSSTTNSGSSSPSGDTNSSGGGGGGGNSSSSSSSSASLSLPKLVPCWRKDGKSHHHSINEGKESNNCKVKKSVRISDDLPRWGKMKRRMGKHDRSCSLSELCNDDELSPSMFLTDLEPNYSSSSSRRKQISSNMNLCDNSSSIKTTPGKVVEGSSSSSTIWSHSLSSKQNDSEQQRNNMEHKDSFIVCGDENLSSSGKVQVHIFLPQTENSHTCGKVVEGRTATTTVDNESNFSGRSEESTT